MSCNFHYKRRANGVDIEGKICGSDYNVEDGRCFQHRDHFDPQVDTEENKCTYYFLLGRNMGTRCQKRGGSNGRCRDHVHCGATKILTEEEKNTIYSRLQAINLQIEKTSQFDKEDDQDESFSEDEKDNSEEVGASTFHDQAKDIYTMRLLGYKFLYIQGGRLVNHILSGCILYAKDPTNLRAIGFLEFNMDYETSMYPVNSVLIKPTETQLAKLKELGIKYEEDKLSNYVE